jgi:hypothetical protein
LGAFPPFPNFGAPPNPIALAQFCRGHVCCENILNISFVRESPPGGSTMQTLRSLALHTGNIFVEPAARHNAPSRTSLAASCFRQPTMILLALLCGASAFSGQACDAHALAARHTLVPQTPRVDSLRGGEDRTRSLSASRQDATLGSVEEPIDEGRMESKNSDVPPERGRWVRPTD